MDPKIKKGLRLTAAAIFVFALALNIKITLDDPFLLLSDEAIAVTTSNSSSSGVDPGSCTNFSCIYYKTSGPIRVWDPYLQQWIWAYSQDEVPGHYLDCENDGWANVCLCDPTCYEGVVGNV